MQLPVHCVSLKVVKYNDHSSIVTAWSRERGHMAFAVPAGASRDARRRKALMMPLGLFEGVANIHHAREISTITDVRPMAPWNGASGDPVQVTMSWFLSDFLNVVLREGQPDPLLADFIFDNLARLGALRGRALANFHLYFLFHLTEMLGIAPDMGTYAPGRGFDMHEGRFFDNPELRKDCLMPDDSRMVLTLSRLRIRSLGLLRLTQEQRRWVLKMILGYYDRHLVTVSALDSLSILNTLYE